MRVTITVDSASPQEIWNLTTAFQRTAGIPLPPQITTRPTVTVGGSAMGWETPAMTVKRAETLLAEWRLLRDEDTRLAAMLPVKPQPCDCACNGPDRDYCGGCGHDGCGW